ncbi:MAG: hypothetical protein ABSD89_13295 [Halobacteriota archaeon]
MSNLCDNCATPEFWGGYPREFEDTLTEIPTFSQEPKDVLRTRLTVGELKREFDFKRIIQNLEELVLANAGVDEFNEIFKLIFAKLYDEKAARDRKNQEVAFRKSDDPEVTYEVIDMGWRGSNDSIRRKRGGFSSRTRILGTAGYCYIMTQPLMPRP